MEYYQDILKIVRNYVDSIPFEVGPFGIAQHPFFTSFATIDMRTNKMIKITKKNLKLLLEQRYKHLEKMLKTDKEFTRLFMMIHKPYRLPIFVQLIEFFNEKQYSEILIDLWISTEFPHQNGVSLMCNLFDKSKKRYMMDNEEKKRLKNLGNIITIYRGLQGEAKIKALSWTLDKKQAIWFATRFSQKGRVFKSQIEKKYIYAYKNDRGESEVIINPNHLMRIEEVLYPVEE